MEQFKLKNLTKRSLNTDFKLMIIEFTSITEVTVLLELKFITKFLKIMVL